MAASLWSLSDIVFLPGGLTFGIASLRAGVRSRWAAGPVTLGFRLGPAVWRAAARSGAVRGGADRPGPGLAGPVALVRPPHSGRALGL